MSGQQGVQGQQQRGQNKLTLLEYIEKHHQQLMAFKFRQKDDSEFDDLPRLPDQIVPWSEFPTLHRELWDALQGDWSLMNDRSFPDLKIRKEFPNITDAKHEVNKYLNEYIWNPMRLLFDELNWKTYLQQRYGSIDELWHIADPESIRAWRHAEYEQFGFAFVSLCPDEISESMLLVGFHKIIQNKLVQGKTFQTVPNNLEGLAERLLIADMIEVYSEMIQAQVKYGCLWTNNGSVLFKLNDENPGIVECHLSIPKRDTIDHKNRVNVSCTELAQMLTFVLNTIDHTPSQAWCHAIGEMKSFPPIPGISYKTWSTTSYDKNPAAHYTSLAQRVLGTRNSLSLRTPRRNGNRQGPIVAEQYCTMACLRGLITSGSLDPRCPNTKRHDPDNNKKHPFGAPELLGRLERQINNDPEDGLQQLHICGHSGHLLKTVLRSHGYVLVVKAVAREHTGHILHELNVYEVIRRLQGIDVPVCVGGFAPQPGYWCHGEKICFMMVMSFAGVRFDEEDDEERKASCVKEMFPCQQRIRNEGADFQLVVRNSLWNQELGHVVAVDFERAKVDRTSLCARRKI